MVDFKNIYGTIADDNFDTDETLDLVDTFDGITSDDVAEAVDELFGEPSLVKRVGELRIATY